MVLAGVWEKKHRKPRALRLHAPCSMQSSPAPPLNPAQPLAAVANPSTSFLDLRLHFLEDLLVLVPSVTHLVIFPYDIL